MLKGSCKNVKASATDCSLVGDHKNDRVYKYVVYRSALDHILNFQHPISIDPILHIIPVHCNVKLKLLHLH